MNEHLLLMTGITMLSFVSGCVSFDAREARQNQTDEFIQELKQKEASLLAKPLTLDICIATAMTNNYEVRLAALDTELGRLLSGGTI